MQRRLILAGASAQAVGTLAAAVIPGAGVAQPESQVLAAAIGSVVKVAADGVGATGFLWPDSQHVVTALHVVDNSSRIVVNFIDAQARLVDSQIAHVERVLQAADLVLLRLAQPQARRPLELARSAPTVNQVMSALGFPLNISGHSSTDVKLRFGGRSLQSILPAKVLAQITDYPDPKMDVLNLEGNLVPGLSGAPLLDGHGRVCGIADGGLEEGAIGICWGIPSTQLDSLLSSNIRRTPGASKLKQLFAADLQADVGPVVGSADGTLTKLRTRSFSQLAATVDDSLGLAQLAQYFGVFRPSEFNYDVYQNDTTGASVALPAGASVRSEAGFLVARTPERGMKILMRIQRVASDMETQLASQRFVRDVTGADLPETILQPDQAWSNLLPVRRGALLVWRGGTLIAKSSSTGFPQPKAYVFQALATNGRGFFGVAALKEDASLPTRQFEQACIMGGADPGCAKVFEQARTWAQMVLGVQFSSFPF